MTSTFRGMGGYKFKLFNEITTAFAGKEFSFRDAKTLPSFEYRAYLRLYHAGLLKFSQKGTKRIWKVTDYTPWNHGQSSNAGAAS